jgi:hypothetical protein
MSVYRDKRSPYYQFEFQREGHRHYGSTKCLKRAEAEAFETAKIEQVERANRALMLASTLPRHVVREPFGDGWRYYFIVPAKARQAGCPIKNEGLGTAFEAAVARAEDVLLPSLDAWQLAHGAETAEDPIERSDPDVGVYILLLKGKIVYVGSSRTMRRRVAKHRTNGRPFDQVFYVATAEAERLRLEMTLIKAINPPGNIKGAQDSPPPDCVPEYFTAAAKSTATLD